MLLAGDLNKRVRFEEDLGSSDANGQHTADWQINCTRWALIELATDVRFAPLRLRYPEARWAIAVRYDRESVLLRPPMRANRYMTGEVYQLLGTGLDPDGSRRELHFPVAEAFLVRAGADR